MSLAMVVSLSFDFSRAICGLQTLEMLTHNGVRDKDLGFKSLRDRPIKGH